MSGISPSPSPPVPSAVDEKVSVDAEKQAAAAAVPAAADDVSTSLNLDEAEEARLVRRLDCFIIPPVMLLYTFSFLDRVNIGNAKLYGMIEDLDLTGNRYQVAVCILFAPYILSELPSNLVLKKFRPSRWIAFISLSWGIIATLTGTVQSYGGLIACRVVLGLVEGGLFPGMAIYLTFFYTKREIALRIGYLFVSAAISGAFGGLLSYAIHYMDGLGSLASWRWIFILQGLPSVVLGIVSFFLLADSPATAFYLDERQKRIMQARLAQQPGWSPSSAKFHRRDVYAALKDWKIWVFVVALFGVDTMLYGYSTFLPTIIEGLGTWSTAESQALTVPCYALGAITYMITARLSDAHQKRALYSIIFGCISVVGYVILATDTNASVRYFACFLVAMGLYTAVGLPLAWLPSNQPRYGKKTTATGLQLMGGNCAGVLTAFLYPKADGPRYVKGQVVSASMVAFGMLCYAGMWWWFDRVNRKRTRGDEDWKIDGMTEDEVRELGDESPRYLYTI